MLTHIYFPIKILSDIWLLPNIFSLGDIRTPSNVSELQGFPGTAITFRNMSSFRMSRKDLIFFKMFNEWRSRHRTALDAPDKYSNELSFSLVAFLGSMQRGMCAGEMCRSESVHSTLNTPAECRNHLHRTSVALKVILLLHSYVETAV